MSVRWDSSRIHEFSQLRRLQIESDTITVAELVKAVVSPNLRGIQLGCSHPVSQAGGIPYGVTNLLHEILRILCNRSAESLRSVNINFEQVYLRHSETDSDSNFLHLIRPTLQFHRLEQLIINAIAAYNGELVMGMLTPAILAAWPKIELLSIPVLSVSPDTLEAATRTCPNLKSLTVMRLSEIFLGRLEAAIQNHSRRDGHELQELRLCIPAKVADPANTTEIAHFLCQLFP
ncbi:hypothetical protein DAEQUDRAFT_559909 [Daedalea quercina L-15889]|uniref:F-box domain-containing protein n=1 Tax=Daedalea quercina L-15889 TaxID=1314783 RepID=A0A165M0R0_9APHY|nr:hypothetical protein DAEQUDRAFT_559909 [Daedalea quercina L-15889]